MTTAAYRIARVTEPLINDITLRRATYYISPTLVVKATRHNKIDKRSRHESFVVSFGRPNFLERRFIKQCVKAGQSFPVRKIQLRGWPVKRKK